MENSTVEDAAIRSTRIVPNRTTKQNALPIVSQTTSRSIPERGNRSRQKKAPTEVGAFEI